ASLRKRPGTPRRYFDWHGCYAVSMALLARLRFVEADTRQLGINEDAIRNQPVARGAPATVQVFMNDAEVILGHVSAIRTARALSHRPHVRRGCFQAIVHLDVALGRDVDSSLLQSDAGGIRSSPDRHENVGSRDCSRPIVILDLYTHFFAGTAFDALDVRI